MHLDARSWYSFHDGVSAPKQLVQAALELGYRSLGLCDLDGVYGLIDFHRAAQREGLRPVLGLALSDPLASRTQPQAGATRDTSRAAAVLLARDRDGYHSLCQLASWRQGAHPDPEVNRYDLRTALARLSIRCFIITDQASLLQHLAPRFGPRYVFVRLDPDYGNPQRARQHRQERLAQQYRLHLAACTDVRFIRPQDQPVHHLLRAIGQNTGVQWATGVRPNQHYMAGPFELHTCFPNHPGALKIAQEIAARCEVELPEGVWDFPNYETPGGGQLSRDQGAQALGELCRHYARKRYPGDTWSPAHAQRLDYELDVIYQFRFTSYFLACWDIVHEAWRRGMPTLGRGSAGNSLVSYLLGITPVDPLDLNLPFERFINPARTSPPDIDIDFDWRRRDEIIDYIFQRWGRRRVARISTHVTFRGRGAWSAAAKACGIPEREARRLSKRLPWVNPSGLKQLHKYPELKGIDLSDQWTRDALNLASRLSWQDGSTERGIPTHLGVHCGGIVIAPGDITRYTALQPSPCGHPVTHYEMNGVEDSGLIKIDLLGNRSLAVLVDTVSALRERGIQPPVADYRRIDNDQPARAMIQAGRTMGCFYIESPAMRQLLKRLGTSSFLEMTAASSVIRPGVAESGMMQEYIRRVRHLPREQDSHPLMERIMPETHGVMVYQEDVIRVGHEAAGFSRSDADVLRRGMSGKLRIREQITQLRDRFVEGCRSNGLGVRDALEIWRQVESFSGYAFCKAHSASFATLSMQVAYLKAHHPAEFMAAVLSNGGGFYGPQAYLGECRRLGLSILPPCINHSRLAHHAERPDAIRIGLSAIKRLPQALKQRIVAAREHGGPFGSLQDLVRRLRPGPAWLELLIDLGALDSFGLSRPELFRLATAEYGRALANGTAGSAQLFQADESAAAAREQTGAVAQPGLAALCASELAHLGFVTRCHPLELVAELPSGVINARDLASYVGQRVSLRGWFVASKRVGVKERQDAAGWLAQLGEELDGPEEYFELEDNDHASTAEDLGILSGSGTSTQYRNRGGRAMLMLSLEDTTETFEAVLFPAAYERFAHLIGGRGPWLLTGVVDEMFGAFTLNVAALRPLELTGSPGTGQPTNETAPTPAPVRE